MNNMPSIMRKQKGATLFSALTILVVLTIVGISAVRISVVDIKVASNEEQKVATSQLTSNALIDITKPVFLYNWLERKKKDPDDLGIDDVTNGKIHAKRTISSAEVEYPCMGNGGAVSIGIDAPSCRVFEFNVDVSKKGSGVKDSHFRGAGKEVPRNSNVY